MAGKPGFAGGKKLFSEAFASAEKDDFGMWGGFAEHAGDFLEWKVFLVVQQTADLFFEIKRLQMELKMLLKSIEAQKLKVFVFCFLLL